MRANSGALPAPVAGWVRNYAVANYWRIEGNASYAIDDLCQDGLLIAVSCRHRYGTPGVDITDQHFMSLVQSSFKRHVIDLVRKLAVRGDTVYVADQGTSDISVRE